VKGKQDTKLIRTERKIVKGRQETGLKNTERNSERTAGHKDDQDRKSDSERQRQDIGLTWTDSDGGGGGGVVGWLFNEPIFQMVLRPITVGNAGSTVGDQQGAEGGGDIVLVILNRGLQWALL
jgi:hypothetical protein